MFKRRPCSFVFPQFILLSNYWNSIGHKIELGNQDWYCRHNTPSFIFLLTPTTDVENTECMLFHCLTKSKYLKFQLPLQLEVAMWYMSGQRDLIWSIPGKTLLFWKKKKKWLALLVLPLLQSDCHWSSMVLLQWRDKHDKVQE